MLVRSAIIAFICLASQPVLAEEEEPNLIPNQAKPLVKNFKEMPIEQLAKEIRLGNVCMNIDELPQNQQLGYNGAPNDPNNVERLPLHQKWDNYCENLFDIGSSSSVSKGCVAFMSCAGFDIFSESNLDRLCCKACVEFAENYVEGLCSDENTFLSDMFGKTFNDISDNVLENLGAKEKLQKSDL